MVAVVSDHPAIRSRFNLVLAALLLLLFEANGALPSGPPEQFFSNVADRLLQQQLGMRLRDIQIAPSNQYDSAVHRIFQVTANIYDATTTNELPSVFRPLVETRGDGVFLAGFTNDHRVSTLGAWIADNTNGLPLVIGAKKGLPNFNEFTLRSDVLVQRRLEVTRPNTNPGARPNGTNQMYILGLSNYFGVEAWNSYDPSGAGPYPRPVTIVASNFVTVSLWNILGLQTNSTVRVAGTTNVAAGTWIGGETRGFFLPLNTNCVFLSNAVYRFNENVFANENANVFETTPAGFPLPYWIYSISNRLTYLMSEPDGDGERIVDFVLLEDGQIVDLFRDLVAGANPYQGIGNVSAAVANVWDTNRVSSNGPTTGIRQQMDIALGNVNVSNSEWREFGLSPTANESDKSKAIDAFRVFCGFGPLTTNQVATNGLAMPTPFNPAAKLSVLGTWQADDPLVHYHLADLLLGGVATNHQYLKPAQPGTNAAPSSLGRLNVRYSPWGGRPDSSYESPTAYNLSLKDPGLISSDDWNFPSGVTPAPGWLGRIHRGTPWQTIYLKSEPAPVGGPSGWTNQSPDLVRAIDGSLFSRTHPTNDWAMVRWFAQIWNTNDLRTLTSANTTNEATWKACFTGLTVLSNDLSNPVLGQPPRFETNAIAPDASQLRTIIAGIARTRSSQRGQYFTDVGAFLSVPELSVSSPWLNRTGDQLKWGLTDEAYEILPSQLLSLVRPDPVGTALRSDAGIELRFTAFGGCAYRVEGSADFVAWETVSEPHYGVEGAFTLTVPLSSNWKFFRALWLP